MNICGVVIHLSPHAAPGLPARIAALPGVELQASAGDGRLAATIIDSDGAMAIEQIAAIHRMPGVVAASLIFHAVDAPEPDCDCCPDGATATHHGRAIAPPASLQIR